VETCERNGSARSRIPFDNLLVNIDWTSPRRLVYSRAVEASPVLASNLWELKLDDKTGVPRGKPRRLTDWSGFLVWRMSATVDGKHLAFLRGTYYQPLFVGELTGNGNRLLNAQRLTADEYINMPVGWSADSRELIFTSNRGGTYGIYKQALDGSAARTVNASLALDVGVARLSPDGSWILFNAAPHQSPRAVPSLLYRLGVNGGAAQPLFEAKDVLNLSCSGRSANLCVYASPNEGRGELIFTAFDPMSGKGKEVLRIPNESRGRPNWMLSPDGSRIALVKKHEIRNQVEFIPLAGGETRTVELKGPFLSGRSVEWAPDSQSVFVGAEGSHSATLLHVDLKGNVQPIWRQAHVGAVGGAPSPDGRRIAIGATGFNTNVWLIDNF
jgi:hypothetical protein